MCPHSISNTFGSSGRLAGSIITTAALHSMGSRTVTCKSQLSEPWSETINTAFTGLRSYQFQTSHSNTNAEIHTSLFCFLFPVFFCHIFITSNIFLIQGYHFICQDSFLLIIFIIFFFFLHVLYYIFYFIQ